MYLACGPETASTRPTESGIIPSQGDYSGVRREGFEPPNPRIKSPLLCYQISALHVAPCRAVRDSARSGAAWCQARRDRRWLFLTGIRGLLVIALDDRERAESAYQALLPFAARPAGADTMLITLWPVAHILGDLARYLGIPGAQAHYQHALAIAEQAHVEPWREAAIRRLD